MNDMELIAENELANFYRNSLTRSFDRDASSIGLKCIIAETKDGSKREYVVLNRKGDPIKAHTNFESIAVFLDVKKRLAKRT